MELFGHVQNGVIIPEGGTLLPEGTTVQISLRPVNGKPETPDAYVEPDWDDLYEEKSPEQWVADFMAWADSHPPVYHFVDDSRESIYEGCGD